MLPRPRWCPFERRMALWEKATVHNRKVKLCMACGRETKAKKPAPPKNRAADRQWSKAVRQGQTGTCEACATKGWPYWKDCSGVSDAAHVRAKGAQPALRHDTRNGIGLCRRAHEWFTRHPVAWQAWIATARPGLLEQLAESAS